MVIQMSNYKPQVLVGIISGMTIMVSGWYYLSHYKPPIWN